MPAPFCTERMLPMKAIEIAHRLAELGQVKDACDAYILALHENGGADPAEEMEAALYMFRAGWDYQIPYTSFQRLYNEGHFREDCLDIMTKAFYEPNVKEFKIRYAKNCKLLGKYPYLFRRDFLPFEELPIRFYPYDNNGYLPFCPAREHFDNYTDFCRPVVTRNFFHDLENPILAQDVFSQYELEYLCDNVRKSENIGRENHIYLHYTDWGQFCAYLQCLDFRPLLKEKKIVFLIGNDIEQYPIDFKERFGIDYSVYPVKPIMIQDISRLIWHTQLSSHNGGDMFNEVFDGHPNLIASSSLLFNSMKETIASIHKMLNGSTSVVEAVKIFDGWDPSLISELYMLKKKRTDKDVLVGMILRDTRNAERKNGRWLDEGARIAPALFFQPHFPNMLYSINVDEKNRTVLHSKQYDQIIESPMLNGFKYIKTFTPMRRMTTSYGATVRFMYNWETKNGGLMGDVVSQRVLNRSFMIDWQNRLFKDSILVRFEDGKLNPKATFTALAAFLDIPYTESMTCGSVLGKPVDYRGAYGGAYSGVFDPVSVYRTYDEFSNDNERCYIEYFLRDAYEYYGYDFQYYDGTDMDLARIEELVSGFSALDGRMREVWMKNKRLEPEEEERLDPEARENAVAQLASKEEEKARTRRIHNAQLLLRNLRFVNKNGQPLHMMPKLELDSALLEQPLYR